MNSIRIEDIASHPDFRRLATLQHGIAVDLRYATPDNFVGHSVYAGIACDWLRREAADALEQAAAWLAGRRPGYRLLVLDALRPQRVQQRLWDELQGTPLTLYLAHPERGSIHSYGMAVDITLLDPAGREVDMGSGFDEMTLASHPDHEAEHLALGALTARHLVERGWLRAAMREAGFHGIPTEWWHFDFGDRVAVRRDLPRVL
ncbi:M15 family metallopeptidase [Roseateles saccharophilus]|uniref:D-alanyl-D-alanine dipeptidase n=1 Tax=Roseateles saccharophilus TaxID=304 RepID=A0A4R3UHV5_ROSSA|nr:M15 family metallopeptidase [Roseateles saccharophilus]MDG0834753.1 D-alanyl-D-alanine dipeptidase [Roseateles saccharophilus]TCU89013.1 D-alanyl-D-alanine dipeptidase [Roseateles saccharophilus]